MDPVISFLRELVSIDSVNPSLVPGAKGEGDAAASVAAEMRRIGLDVQVQEVVEGRPNVIGVLEGAAPGRSLMLCGHLDTVGVEGMTSPFDPWEQDGRLYGRGAQDMKAGIAAMVDAARVVAAQGLPRGRLIVAAVVDEEYASLGADALVRDWDADAAVVTEPTDLRIGVAHKGFAWLAVETRGRAAHGSRPADGRDAILHLGRVLGALEALDRRLQQQCGHARLGAASLHASIITGGRELSCYPDACRLELERRTLPGEGDAQPLRELNDILDACRRDDPTFEAVASAMFSRPPYQIGDSDPLPVALQRAATGCDTPGGLVGMSFWTDAAVLGQAGIPSVLFGPGGAGLHSTKEYVTIADVLACRDVLAELMGTWCGS